MYILFQSKYFSGAHCNQNNSLKYSDLFNYSTLSTICLIKDVASTVSIMRTKHDDFFQSDMHVRMHFNLLKDEWTLIFGWGNERYCDILMVFCSLNSTRVWSLAFGWNNFWLDFSYLLAEHRIIEIFVSWELGVKFMVVYCQGLYFFWVNLAPLCAIVKINHWVR
jgi:hypothetical protein